MKFKILVHWDKSHADAGGTVEVKQHKLSATWDSEFVTVLCKSCGNNDRVYGYCMALVDTLRFNGHEVDMPKCLQGHLGPDRNRED